MRLNLACGTDIRDGDWVNLDCVRKWPLAKRSCDLLWDARTDKIPFRDWSVEEVYAGYLFLHLAPQHHQRVLGEIHRVLQAGGRLVVGEVDMEILMHRWLRDPTDLYLSGLVWGEQGQLPPRHCEPCTREASRGVPFVKCSECQAYAEQERFAEFDKHCFGWVESTLREFLNRGGFRDVRRIVFHGPAVFYELTMECYK